MDNDLTIISRHGWDQCGETNGRLRFRRGDEEVELAPAEVPFWAAQLERPAPAPADAWEARRVFVCAGYIVGPRVVGVTHTPRGETLFLETYADAERAAAALNGRGRQLEMGL